MVYFLVLLIQTVLISFSVSASDVMDVTCHEANATCLLREDCRVRMSMLRSTCGPYGKYCKLPQPTASDVKGQTFVDYCQSLMRTIKKEEKQLLCYCALSLNSEEYAQCMKVWRYLNQHPCSDPPRWEPKQTPIPRTTERQFVPNRPPSEKPRGQLESDLVTQMPVHQQYKNLGMGVKDGSYIKNKSTLSCDVAVSNCKQNEVCRRPLQNFLDNCNVAEQRKCTEHRTICLDAYEKSRRFSIFLCTCHGSSKYYECKRMEKKLKNSPCLEQYNTQTLYGIKVNSRNPKEENIYEGKKPVQFKKIEVFKSENCHEVYSECMRIPECLDLMIKLTEACKWNIKRKRCVNYKSCLSALRNFYGYTTDGITSKAVHCDCPSGHPDCQLQKEVFRPKCAFRSDREAIPSCIQLYNSCHSERNLNCRMALTYYRKNCDVDESTKRCTRTPSNCRQMTRIIWGTMLTQNCTCDPDLSGSENLRQKAYRKVCESMYKLFKKPPCLEMSMTEQKKPFTSEKKNQTLCSMITRRYLGGEEVRIYQNSTCSQLCTCSGYSPRISNCRQLPCSGVDKKCYRLAWEKNCRCFNGETICIRKPSQEAVQPGIYFNVGYSESEKEAIDQHGSEPFSAFGHLNRLLNHTTGDTCQLDLVDIDGESSDVLFRVSLSKNRKYQNSQHRIEKKCKNPVKLLQHFIERRYPVIAHHPQLSAVKMARVEIVVPPNERLKSGGERGSYRETADNTKSAAGISRGSGSARQGGNSGAGQVQSSAAVVLLFAVFTSQLLLSWWSGCCSDERRRTGHR